MFFYLSKLLNFIIHPLLWVFVLLLLSLIFKKKSRAWLVGALMVFIFFSNPLLSNYVMDQWELPATPKENIPLSEVGIVLTGALSHDPELEEQLHFNDAADRLTEAMVLYREGFIKKILITGGSWAIQDQAFQESEVMKSFLVINDFPEEDIIIESNSRNTHENALYTAKVLKEQNLLDRRHLLITSAFHMRRSLGCFAKEEVNVIPYPVDFRSSHVLLDIGWLLPAPGAFSNWNMLIKEWMGIVAYKIAGYI
jgi:uncharacterized SAM-binding protein YcdF (DUF218 family)